MKICSGDVTAVICVQLDLEVSHGHPEISGPDLAPGLKLLVLYTKAMVRNQDDGQRLGVKLRVYLRFLINNKLVMLLGPHLVV